MRKDKPIKMHVPTLCDWFSSPASASDPIPTIWFSLDHKRNVSDGVVSGIGTRFSLDHKVYASYYDFDSDSVASENQPLVAHTKARCVWLVVEGVAWGAKRSQSRIKPNVTKMDQSPATIPAV